MTTHLPRMERTFVVTRPWEHNMTQAIVEAEVVGIANNELAFLGRLKVAVTDWVKKTESGRQAWKSASEDFNVGDLASYCDDPELQLHLRRVGILALKIETNVQDRCQNWEFDTVLVDEEELEENQ